jgi:hypothetical protein
VIVLANIRASKALPYHQHKKETMVDFLQKLTDGSALGERLSTGQQETIKNMKWVVTERLENGEQGLVCSLSFSIPISYVEPDQKLNTAILNYYRHLLNEIVDVSELKLLELLGVPAKVDNDAHSKLVENILGFIEKGIRGNPAYRPYLSDVKPPVDDFNDKLIMVTWYAAVARGDGFYQYFDRIEAQAWVRNKVNPEMIDNTNVVIDRITL